jgi:hypothetical protein
MLMKVGLAALSAVAIALGWWVFSVNATIRQQTVQIQELKAALAGKSTEQALAVQTECAANAQKFLVSRGWKAEEGSSYENHFNSRLNKCFVLVSEYALNDDFRTFDLYDGVEGRHYATYNGHDVCNVVITHNPKKCTVDSGSIWFDGDDTRQPSDFTAGFRGLLYGGGAGDENTQKAFLDRVRGFISQ